MHNLVCASIDKKRQQLLALKEKVHQYRHEHQDTEQYLLNLRSTCLELAYIVLAGKTDRADHPYIQRMLRVGEKASTVFNLCCYVVGEVFEHGKELGLTHIALIEDYLIPAPVMDVAAIYAARPGETHQARIDRIAGNYTATKAAIETAIDAANISEYDIPNIADLDYCSGQMAIAIDLKTQPSYQKQRRMDYVVDLINLSKIEKMVYADEYSRDDDELISLCLYFGFEGYAERRITLRFMAHIARDQSVLMHITTFTNSKELHAHRLYRPRKTTLKLPHVQAVYAYFEEIKSLINQSGTIELRRQQQTLAHVTLGLILHETLIIEEIDRKNS
ncbi:hypothetical protein [Ralstonia phage RP31]|uniref:Uncharacterized protein n=2 Tax=Ripduovirus RP12 TaxID=2560700 RepID=A0A1L7N0T0_9CAUD|nr:hypothetical protein FDH28_gp105 [Ralstonia phage RP12]BAW19079.1 hypothetical protein [Ralstonia phage RP12]BAW19364.1 hypothetical protein [Ralstonia phage RP31]